jgi:hypothetical protein
MRKRTMQATLLSLMLLASLAACSKPQPEPERISLDYDFSADDHGWTGDFTDLPIDYAPDIYELEFAHRERPSSLPEADREGMSLMLSGHNRSDDLFMYIKKQLTTAHGIEPNTTYWLRFTVEFATDAPAGAVGIGGPPGEAVWVKVGAADTEPIPVAEEGSPHPNWILNVDKGNQNNDGESALRIGDVAKVQNEEFDVYELKTLTNNEQPLKAVSDADGSLWIFVGTDSGFEGRTTLYYTRISVELTAK